jgi:hypothetical protein
LAIPSAATVAYKLIPEVDAVPIAKLKASSVPIRNSFLTIGLTLVFAET